MYKYRKCIVCGSIFQPQHSKKKCCGEICRFWSHVDKSNGDNACWIWTSNIITRCGYGNFCNDNRRFITTHRFSYEITYGDIPEKMHILHSCDNHACVNPRHLSVGTAKDNIADMWKKNRQQKYNNHSRGDSHYTRITPEKVRRGEGHPNSKLNEEIVKDIRARYPGETFEAIGKSYKISKSNVCAVVKRKIWAHVL